MIENMVSHSKNEGNSLLRQPKAVWAVAFSCVISFMGIGLVDPILPALRSQLHASKSQVELIFTSYILITGAAMIITDFVSSRIGIKKTLLTGLILIITFSFFAGSSGSIGEIVGFRAGWGFGNALFIATALTAIVASASGGANGAIILYEAALGLGISVGPLLGGFLGGISWRGPFYGVAVLMAIGFISVIFFLREQPKKQQEKQKQHRSLAAPFQALRHRGLLTCGLTALFYNYGFFTLLAFTPFVLNMSAHALGLVFFGWGVLLAITSVFAAPKLHQRFGMYPSMIAVLLCFAVILLIMALNVHSNTILIMMVIIAGAFLGINNTLITTAVMKVAPVERSVASASYSFIRFMGGGIAPWLAALISVAYNNNAIPFYIGCACLIISAFVLTTGKKYLRDL